MRLFLGVTGVFLFEFLQWAEDSLHLFLGVALHLMGVRWAFFCSEGREWHSAYWL